MSEISIVATLIAPSEDAFLTSVRVDKLAETVHATDLCVLAENIAVDLFFDGGQTQEEIRTALAQELAGAPVDIIVQPIKRRRKKLLLADMDSTIIAQECLDELAHKAGKAQEISAQTQRAMRGEVDFAAALRQRVALLKDLPLSVVDEVITEHIHLNPGARTLIATMRQNGGYTSLVSGGFTLFTQQIAKWVGFNEHHANILCHDGGVLTGKVVEPVLGSQAKRQKLLELCQKLALEPSQAMAVGDGANDIAMLQQAGSGIAFHAKPLVREVAAMQVNHSDLTALLYIQGYREQDFVS